MVRFIKKMEKRDSLRWFGLGSVKSEFLKKLSVAVKVCVRRESLLRGSFNRN